MPVRVKLRLRARTGGRVVETSALVNSGFTTDRPQLVVPKRLAVELGIWPPPENAYVAELGTAGGPVRSYIIPESLEVQVVEEDRTSKVVVSDAVISGIEEEVLVNDVLGEELGIVLVKMASGKWRFMDDPPDVIRESKPVQLWI